MSLNYKILANKPNVTIKSSFDGSSTVTMKDLLTRSYVGSANEEFRTLIVNKYYVARPDLVSLAIYGTDEYADILCKINGISNPFELNEDDILVLPSIEAITESFGTPEANTFISSNVSSIGLNTKNNSIKNQNTLSVSNDSAINKKINSYQKEINSERTGNEQVVGDSNYVIDRSTNLVFY